MGILNWGLGNAAGLGKMEEWVSVRFRQIQGVMLTNSHKVKGGSTRQITMLKILFSKNTLTGEQAVVSR